MSSAACLSLQVGRSLRTIIRSRFPPVNDALLARLGASWRRHFLYRSERVVSSRHIHPFFRVRELAFPTRVLDTLMDRKDGLRAFDDIMNGFLDAQEELNGLAERMNQFSVFSVLLPPELDEAAERWNRQAESLASAINQGELKPIAERLQRFRLTTKRGRL
jgi:hypothetical protein